MVIFMHNSYSKFDFRKVTGNVVIHPQRLISIGHTAFISPWSDPNIHKHNASEEYYLLFNGQMHLIIEDFCLTLQPNEILMVKPNVSHAVVGGIGKIEYFGIRTPALDDKHVVSELKTDVPPLHEGERLVSGAWGHRVPLEMAQHKNCWLFGAGSALYKSQHFVMAYLDFPTRETANAGIGTRHQLHFHQKSWEYYAVRSGEKTLLIDDTQVSIQVGEILAVPPNVRHTLHSRKAPYRGFTIRVPVELNDKIVVDSQNTA
jgi:mannose-6-phosphate isomerase-like protein (cupin superfamily)